MVFPFTSRYRMWLLENVLIEAKKVTVEKKGQAVSGGDVSDDSLSVDTLMFVCNDVDLIVTRLKDLKAGIVAQCDLNASSEGEFEVLVRPKL